MMSTPVLQHESAHHEPASAQRPGSGREQRWTPGVRSAGLPVMGALAGQAAESRGTRDVRQASGIGPAIARFQRSAALAAWPSARLGRLTAARAQALFASDLSARREHTQVEVAAAIRRAIGTHHGIGGCAAEVAAAYGEHPETAAGRMRWARAVIEGIDARADWPGAST